MGRPWTISSETSGTLEEGAAAAKQRVFDLVFLDLSLPDSDIDHTVEKGIALFEGLPVLVLTSLKDDSLGRRAVAKGAEDFISKDKLSADELARAMTHALERFAIRTQLAESNRQLKHFAHTLAHEIKNPLQAITFALEMLKETDGGNRAPKMSEMLDVASDSGRHITALIEDLLAFAERGGGEDKIAAIDLNSSLPDIVRSLRASNKGLAFDTDFQPQFPAFLGPAVRFRQVLENLISNSIRYRDQERPLKISATWEMNDGEQNPECTITLADNGVGIHEDDLPNIFEPFFRSSRTSSIEGSGLGLNFCKRVIDEMGGRIEVKSKVGEGSQFVLKIPISD